MRRRIFVAAAGVLPHSIARLNAQVSARPVDDEMLFVSKPPTGVVRYLASTLNRLSSEWDRKRNAITKPAGIEERNRFVRQKMVEMIGGFPQRNPLGAVTVRTIERPGYRIENVMFQSRPDFWVTGNLYLPTGGNGPVPAIVSPCGHYPLARMTAQYQRAYLNLVHNGFAVLAYDPIGQGERRQYWNPNNDVTEVGGPVEEHSMAGHLLFLFGESLAEYRIWDGMRAIDYLASRSEVDSERIGCTGHSGGGTLTLFISALDARVKCAVVHEGGTANRWPVRLNADTPLRFMDAEQDLFPAAIYGIDNADLHIAVAPRPLLATIEHYNPDFDASAAYIRTRYRQLGVADKFSTVPADDPHAWTYRLRLATTDWFSRWLMGHPGPATEPELPVEAPQDLSCTGNGSLRYSHRGDTVWSLMAKKQIRLSERVHLPIEEQRSEAYRDRMTARIQEVLRLKKLDASLNVRHVGDVDRKGYRIEKVEFSSEPGIVIPTWIYIPKKRQLRAPAILYFSEAGKDADGMEFEGAEASGPKPGVLAQLAQYGNVVIAADVRGIGESRPSNRSAATMVGEFRHLFDTETALTYMAWFANRSLFGMRVQDAMRTVDYAFTREDLHGNGVRVIGKDMGGLWALYAAALDSRIDAVVAHGSLISYQSLTRTDRYLHGSNIIVPGVLNYFDVPDVVAAISPRQASLMSPVDPMKLPLNIALSREAYRTAEAAYSVGGAAGRFQISACDPDEDLAVQYLRLLGMEAAGVRG